ncbi:MAG: hypothetical protein NG737_00765, partial [Omnitrophica bacterium]|nr:hypothetical protein [Candidatus Omnitrophota bacterium]
MKKHLVILNIIALLVLSFSFSSTSWAKPYHTRYNKAYTHRHRHHKHHTYTRGYWTWDRRLREYVWIS